MKRFPILIALIALLMAPSARAGALRSAGRGAAFVCEKAGDGLIAAGKGVKQAPAKISRGAKRAGRFVWRVIY